MNKDILRESQSLTERCPFKFGCNIASYLYVQAQEGDGDILEYMEEDGGVAVTRFHLSDDESQHFEVSPGPWSTCYLIEDDQGFVTAQTFWEEPEDDE